MGLDLGVDACLEILAPVADASRRHGVFVRIDMESSDYTDRTLEVVERLRADGVDAGPVIQAYLHRSPVDVERLAAERVRTRICKGAYAEVPTSRSPSARRSATLSWRSRATCSRPTPIPVSRRTIPT